MYSKNSKRKIISIIFIVTSILFAALAFFLAYIIQTRDLAAKQSEASVNCQVEYENCLVSCIGREPDRNRCGSRPNCGSGPNYDRCQTMAEMASRAHSNCLNDCSAFRLREQANCSLNLNPLAASSCTADVDRAYNECRNKCDQDRSRAESEYNSCTSRAQIEYHSCMERLQSYESCTSQLDREVREYNNRRNNICPAQCGSERDLCLEQARQSITSNRTPTQNPTRTTQTPTQNPTQNPTRTTQTPIQSPAQSPTESPTQSPTQSPVNNAENSSPSGGAVSNPVSDGSSSSDSGVNTGSSSSSPSTGGGSSSSGSGTSSGSSSSGSGVNSGSSSSSSSTGGGSSSSGSGTNSGSSSSGSGGTAPVPECVGISSTKSVLSPGQSAIITMQVKNVANNEGRLFIFNKQNSTCDGVNLPCPAEIPARDADRDSNGLPISSAIRIDETGRRYFVTPGDNLNPVKTYRWTITYEHLFGPSVIDNRTGQALQEVQLNGFIWGLAPYGFSPNCVTWIYRASTSSTPTQTTTLTNPTNEVTTTRTLGGGDTTTYTTAGGSGSTGNVDGSRGASLPDTGINETITWIVVGVIVIAFGIAFLHRMKSFEERIFE